MEIQNKNQDIANNMDKKGHQTQGKEGSLLESGAVSPPDGSSYPMIYVDLVAKANRDLKVTVDVKKTFVRELLIAGYRESLPYMSSQMFTLL